MNGSWRCPGCGDRFVTRPALEVHVEACDLFQNGPGED